METDLYRTVKAELSEDMTHELRTEECNKGSNATRGKP